MKPERSRDRNGWLRSLATSGLNGFLRLVQWGSRPILIIGHGRSGTTWIGRTLAQAPEALYYDEPSNPDRWPDGSFAHWFSYLRPGQSDLYFERSLDPAFRGLVCPGRWWGKRQLPRRLLPAFRPIVKEVAPVMAVEWVCHRYQPAVLVVVRHPCAVALSEFERHVDGPGSTREILAREDLLQDHLGHDERSTLEQARQPYELYGAVWGARNRVLANALTRHPEWHLLVYEELAEDPLRGFEALYTHFGLSWTRTVASYVERTTTREVPGRDSTARISRQRANRWKTAMSREDKEQVRDFVLPFGLPFFSEPGEYDV